LSQILQDLSKFPLVLVADRVMTTWKIILKFNKKEEEEEEEEEGSIEDNTDPSLGKILMDTALRVQNPKMTET